MRSICKLYWECSAVTTTSSSWACPGCSSTLISGSITDEKGRFSLDKLPFGTLAVEVQFLGYQTFEQTVELHDNQRTINLNEVLLQPG
ncbi:MAG: carboxypeptidase-like regulatory domain-containing protein, partial [Bacteroidota bacterium]